MQRNDRPHQTTHINHQQLIVRLARKRPRQTLLPQIRQQIQRVLQTIHDRVVHRHRPRRDVGEVPLNVGDARFEAAERGELRAHPGGERRRRGVFDVAEEVLDADFFGFFGFDRGRGVEERFPRFGAVLLHRAECGVMGVMSMSVNCKDEV